jgi:hypothetical protein
MFIAILEHDNFSDECRRKKLGLQVDNRIITA